MTTQENKRAMIRAVPTFAGLSEDDCDALLACVRMRTFDKGATVFEQGAPGDTMLIVGQGDIQISMIVGPDKTETIRTMSAGSVLGEMACVDPAPRSATATASTPVTVFELNRDGLDAIGRMVPGVASVIVGAIIRDVTARLRDIEGRIDRELEQRGSEVLVGHTPPLRTAAAAEQGAPKRSSGHWRLLDNLKEND